jgi:hypothetical protein
MSQELKEQLTAVFHGHSKSSHDSTVQKVGWRSTGLIVTKV